MRAYFLHLNRRQLLLFKSLHRRVIFARSINFTSQTNDSPAGETSTLQRDPRLTNAQPSPDETPSTTTSPPEPHLSPIFIHGERMFPTTSFEWKFIRKHILLRDNSTCSSCGYISPSHGRFMKIGRKDGDLSNNNLSNLKTHCPPCFAILHSIDFVFFPLPITLVTGESTMDQVEIVRKTREMFEKTGVIPHPKYIDPSVKPSDTSMFYLVNMMSMTPREDLPEELRRLRGFFTEHGSPLFQNTMLTGKSATKKLNDNATEAPFFDWRQKKASKFSPTDENCPWISYSEELHGSEQAFLDSYPPSKISRTQVAWIRVDSSKSKKLDWENEYPNKEDFSYAWIKLHADGLDTLSEVEKLAEQFNILSGKWLVSASSDEVDNLWGQIVKSTLAGTLGISATVLPRYKNRHVICVYNDDYRSMEEVNRIRDRLRELGVKERIYYKPDIYTHCGIHAGNKWGISPMRYNSL